MLTLRPKLCDFIGHCFICHNRSKASELPFVWFNKDNRNYSDLRADKLKKWLEQKPCSIKINSTDNAIPYLANDATIGWIAT